MVSLARTVRSFIRTGPRYWARMLLSISDAKSGEFVGRDAFGNRYFQNYNAEEEVPGRHRWVDLNQFYWSPDSSQIPSEWHSWLHHIRQDPPTKDVVMQANVRPWRTEWSESLTGTRGAYKPYSTQTPNVYTWDSKVKERLIGTENKN